MGWDNMVVYCVVMTSVDMTRQVSQGRRRLCAILSARSILKFVNPHVFFSGHNIQHTWRDLLLAPPAHEPLG